jgi:hypothetical protein
MEKPSMLQRLEKRADEIIHDPLVQDAALGLGAASLIAVGVAEEKFGAATKLAEVMKNGFPDGKSLLSGFGLADNTPLAESEAHYVVQRLNRISRLDHDGPCIAFHDPVLDFLSGPRPEAVTLEDLGFHPSSAADLKPLSFNFDRAAGAVGKTQFLKGSVVGDVVAVKVEPPSDPEIASIEERLEEIRRANIY